MGSYLSFNRTSNADESSVSVNGAELNGHNENGEQIEFISKSNHNQIEIKGCSVILEKDKVNTFLNDDKKLADPDEAISYDEVVSSYEKAHQATNDTGIDSTEATFGTLNDSKITAEDANDVELDDDKTKQRDDDDNEDELTDKIRDQYRKVKNLKHQQQQQQRNKADEHLPVARKSAPTVNAGGDQRFHCTVAGCNKSYKIAFSLQRHQQKKHEQPSDDVQTTAAGGVNRTKRIREIMENESTTDSHTESDVSSLSDFQVTPKKRREKQTKRKKV